jgi:hypothetical protein
MEVKMARNHFFFRFLAALLVVGILAAAGVAVYRAGVTQGYLQAAATAEDGGALTRPGAPYPYFPGYWGPRFGFGFFPFFPFVGFFFFGLLLFLLFRFQFRPWHWSHPGYWHGYPPNWGPPPWAKDRPADQPEAQYPPQPGNPESQDR